MAEVLLRNEADGVLTLTFNRPKAFNAFTRELALAVQDAIDYAGATEAVRAVVVTATGKAFCAGQDLQELQAEGPGFMERILKEHFNPVVEKIRACPKPILAAVNGVAAGAGANIAIACDIVLAAESASFIQAFCKIGLIPDSGGTWTLPRIVGWQKASALMMTGDKLSATEAERLGMVYKLIPDEELSQEAHRLAAKLAQMPTKALALTKQALQASETNTFDQQLVAEDRIQGIAAQTADYAEGVSAFVEKRRPKFVGA